MKFYFAIEDQRLHTCMYRYAYRRADNAYEHMLAAWGNTAKFLHAWYGCHVGKEPVHPEYLAKCCVRIAILATVAATGV